MTVRRRVVALAGLAALALAPGCGGGGSRPPTAGPSSAAPAVASPGPGGVQRVTIDATDALRFVPDVIRARPGRLAITVRNVGNVPHDLSVPALHAEIPIINGSETRTVTVAVPRPGRYRFVCDFHASAGMQGMLEVDASS